MAEVEIVEVKPQLVVGLRRKGHYKDMAQMIPELFKFIMGTGII